MQHECMHAILHWGSFRPRRTSYCTILVHPYHHPLWNIVNNTLGPRRNEQHFADDIFKRIFFNENVWISIKISLKFVSNGPINNIPVLVQMMVWRRSGDKPLSEPMMVGLLTHICVTRPQWDNQTALGPRLLVRQMLRVTALVIKAQIKDGDTAKLL